MKKYITITIIAFVVLGLLYIKPIFGAFSDTFLSIQLAPSPSNGKCLTTDGTDNVWSTCASGSGGGGGTFSTTTITGWSGVLLNYPNNDTDVVLIGSTSGTSTAEYYFDPNGNQARIGATNTASTTLMGNVYFPTKGQGFFYGGSNGLLNAMSTTTLVGNFLTSTGYGYSTSTVFGFLGGLFSTASSTFSSSLFLPSLGQGILYTGTNGIVKATATSTFSLSQFTNDLANLTAGNTSLTFSGSYNGSTARTVVLNVGNANTWTALQTFGAASSTQFSISGWLGIPASSDPTVGSTGTLAINTTTASTSLRFYDGSAERNLTDIHQGGFIFSTSTSATFNGTGTSTISRKIIQPRTYLTVACTATTTGTAFVRIGDGTNYTNTIPCTTSGVITTISSNGSFVMGEKVDFQIGTITSLDQYLEIDYTYRVDAD